MNESVLEELFSIWEKTYFIKPVLLICIILSITIGLMSYRKETLYKYFLVYLFINFIVVVLIDTNTYKKHSNLRTNTLIVETGNTIIALIELLVFFKYFSLIIYNKVIKYIMSACGFAFFAIVIIFLIKIINPNFDRDQIRSLSFKINVIEFFFLLFPCLLFFYELFTREVLNELTESPSFWITTGLFFYCIVSLPFLLIGDNLAVNNRNLFNVMFAIHYTSLSFLFLMLTKAFLCKKPLNT